MERIPTGAAFLIAVVLWAGCQPAEEGSIEAVAVPEYTIEEFLGNTSIFGASFAPSGDKILVSSDQTGVYNAFAIPLRHPGGRR